MFQHRVRITLIAGLFLVLSAVHARPDVIRGDVAIVRANGDAAVGADSFSLLVLRDVVAAESLYWTDCGWSNVNTFAALEGAGSTDIITADVARGTVIEVPAASIAATGDQFMLFTGTKQSPVLVYGLDFGNAQGWDADRIDSQTSADPAVTGSGLSDQHTVSLGTGATWTYTGPTSGTADDLLNNIGNYANWTASSDASWPGGSFTVTPVPEPATVALLALGCGILYTRRRARR